jgi:hypothetical protein
MCKEYTVLLLTSCSSIKLIVVDKVIITCFPILSNLFLILLNWFIVISNIISVKFRDFLFLVKFERFPVIANTVPFKFKGT